MIGGTVVKLTFSLAIVVVKMILCISSDVQVDESIIIEVACCHSHAVTIAFQSGTFSYILESTISLLLIKAIPKPWVRFVREAVA